ncbi:MAG: polyprenyl synthetase family protein [Bacteroidales bacterium]|nr:polyprenyl synthetase family protein [Bacteroidales bacterium]
MIDNQKRYIEIINSTLAAQDFLDKPAELFEPITYTMALGGKRIRPFLSLMCCEMFGGDIKDVLYPALGYEIFHNFTLIHDDILDQAEIRRGKETVYKKWNTNIAILAGDTMFAIAYKYFFKTKTEYIIPSLEIFNKTAIDVCRGQQYDMNFETQENVTIEDYIEMIRLKTAVLLGACAKTGAIIAGTTSENANKIYDFSEKLGIAFQLKDDLLDLYSDESLFGKKNGGDIISCKKTFLFIKALSLCDSHKRRDLTHLYNEKNISPDEKINNIKNIYDSIGIKDITELEISSYYQKATKSLQYVNVDEDKKESMYNFGNQLMKRIY